MVDAALRMSSRVSGSAIGGLVRCVTVGRVPAPVNCDAGYISPSAGCAESTHYIGARCMKGRAAGQPRKGRVRDRNRAAVESLVLGLVALAAVVLGTSPAGRVPALLLVIALTAFHLRVRLRSLAAGQIHLEERQQLRSVLDATEVSTWEAHIDTGEIRVDARYAAMLGRAHGDLASMSVEQWYGLIHSDDRTRADEAIRECFVQAGRVLETDFRMRHADGHWVWMRTRGTVIARDAQGRALHMVGTHVDVTEDKQVELALTASESRFRSLFELSPVGIALNERSSGRFLQINDAMIAPTGYTREELLALTCWDVTVHSRDLSLRHEIAGFSADGRYGPLEREYRRKDGTTYPVLMFGRLMRDDSGREIVWSIVQDISERKALESELAAAALRDRLTGLANRTWFMERLREAIGRVEDGKQALFGVLFLDFDRFKLVNDALGHEAGDQLLNEIG
ncbi:PAS domain S-box protein, partial [bacterium]